MGVDWILGETFDCRASLPELDGPVHAVSGDVDGDGVPELASIDGLGTPHLWTIAG